MIKESTVKFRVICKDGPVKGIELAVDYGAFLAAHLSLLGEGKTVDSFFDDLCLSIGEKLSELISRGRRPAPQPPQAQQAGGQASGQ
jgi:hypothetical protein